MIGTLGGIVMKKFLLENLLKIHYLLYLLPVLLTGGIFFNFLKKVLPVFKNFLQFSPGDKGVFLHYIPFFSADKKESIILYIFLATIAFTYIVVIFLLTHKSLTKKILECIPNFIKKYLYTSIITEVMISAFFSTMLYYLYRNTLENFAFQNLINYIMIIMYFFFFLFLPILLFISQKINKKVTYLAWSVIILNVIVIFVPLIFSKPYIINTYFDLPTSTKIQSNNEIKVVDSIDFINKHNLQAFQKYDFRKDKGKNSFTKGEKFTNHKQFIIETTKKYEKVNNQPLIFSETLIKENEDAPRTNEVSEFLRKKWVENTLQTNDRFFFHHHNFFIGAVNEYDLGKSHKSINSQYGIGSMMIMSGVLNLFGGVSYQGYLNVIFVSYLLYAFLGMFMFYSFSKNKKLSIMLSLGILFSYALVGYTVILMAPGHSPIRHFFDITALSALYFISKNNRGSIKNYVLLLGLLFLSIFMSSSNGLMLSLACVGVIGFDGLFGENKRYRQILYAVLLLIGIALFFKFIGNYENNFLLKYYSNGLIGVGGSVFIHSFMLTIFFVTYIFILLFYDKIQPQLRLVFVGTFFYLQEFYLYYLWMSNIDHFLHITPLIIFFFLIVLLVVKDLWEGKAFTAKSFNKFTSFILVYLSFTSALFLVVYLGSKYYYLKDMNYNVINDWQNHRVKIKTSISEQYFMNAAKLIQKYSPIDSGITIFSKYDNIIPFMAKRYSNSKYSDLQWMLVGEKEFNEVLAEVRNNKPKIIFTDTDIEREFEGDYYPFLTNTFKHEAIMRIARLNKIKQLFLEIKDNYTKVTSGKLITVWERKQ